MPSDQGSGTADWIMQRELSEILGISQQTASEWAKVGRLRRFEHGIETAGRRRYSRLLVQREIENRLDAAKRHQDELLASDHDPRTEGL